MKGFLFMEKLETSLGQAPIPKEAPWKTLVNPLGSENLMSYVWNGAGARLRWNRCLP